MSKVKPLQHWSSGVSDCDVVELAGIKNQIESYLIRAAASFIEIGHSLNRARVLIPGDLEFGQWREEHTPFTARQANNYMKVARKFSTHSLVAKTSLSVLVELSSAPKELTQDVEQAIDDGKPVKRADVQAAKREGKSVDEVLEDRRAKEREKADKKTTEDAARDEHFRIVDEEAAKAKEQAKDANVLEEYNNSQPPEDENTLPPGDYEMIAVTEDEFDLVIAALEFYAADGNDNAMALAERLNK